MGHLKAVLFIHHSVLTTLSSHETQHRVYKQSGVNLIGTDCEVVVIHCIRLKSQMQ